MDSFLKWLAGNSLVRAKILGMARHLASTIAGALGVWLARHGADQSTTADAVQGAGLLITAAASYGFSLWDKSNVADKIDTAQSTGAQSVVTAISQSDAASPQTKAALLADLAKAS